MGKIEDINFVAYYKEPLDAKQIKGTPFYSGALNMVYGLSKSGKSRCIAEILAEAKIKNVEIIWLDKDYNMDKPLLELLKDFKHINDEVDELCDKLLNTETLKNTILVFDSLKDFSRSGLDSNAEAQESMEYIREFTKLGATVILIAHATKWISSDGKKSDFKLQGNSETIQSKCDCVFRFEQKTSKLNIEDQEVKFTVRSFIPERMRISNASTKEVSLYDKNDLTNCIHKLIDENEEMTKRELIKKFSSTISNVINDLEDEAYTVELVGKKKMIHKLPT